jgi:hypothetical protein
MPRLTMLTPRLRSDGYIGIMSAYEPHQETAGRPIAIALGTIPFRRSRRREQPLDPQVAAKVACLTLPFRSE